MIHTLGVITLVLYLTAAAVFSLDLAQDRARRTWVAERLLLAGFIFHSLLAVSTLLDSGSVLPVGRGDFYLFLSWGLPLAYALVRRRMGYPIVGVFLSASTVLFLASSSYLMHSAHEPEVTLGFSFFGLHVFPALLAELCLVIALVLGTIYCIQERRLRTKKAISAALAAPSLDTLGSWMFRLVSSGFIAMSFSVVSGSVWALFHGRSIFTSDPFQWTGFLVWVLFAAIHLVRALRGRSPRTLARMIVAVGVVLMVTLAGLLILGGGTHHASVYLS